jgi:Uncharacterized conserved protein (DUF2267)
LAWASFLSMRAKTGSATLERPLALISPEKVTLVPSSTGSKVQLPSNGKGPEVPLTAVMKCQEFIKEVQERGHMASRESAEEAARATLRTLAERLAGGEPHDLASQLPEELAEHVRYDEEQKSDPFSLEEFFRRVAEKEGPTSRTPSTMPAW